MVSGIPPGRPRILLAPVTITPTKALTPTHIKYLLSLDVLFRATAQLADVTCVYQHQTFATTHQTMRFWWYLDRVRPGADFATASEEEIGELYVRHHAEASEVPHRELLDYARRAEDEDWLHPASGRLLDLWERHFALLNLFDVKLGRHGPDRWSTARTLDELAARNLCLDGTALGVPTYLDLTARGVPLRTIVSADGHANYLVCLLRELLPIVGDFDHVVLAHDRELNADYRMIEQVLAEFGASVSRLEVTRVPIDGAVQSSRFGGWQGFTLDAVKEQCGIDPDGAGPDDRTLAAFRLGLRLYLIAVLGKGSGESFRIEHLRRWIGRAAGLLDAADGDGDPRAFLATLARRHGWVDPYRLVSALLAQHRALPVAATLRALDLRR